MPVILHIIKIDVYNMHIRTKNVYDPKGLVFRRVLIFYKRFYN